ncbi:MAG: hypothetical protein H7289_13015 [Mucilaginibacter sp.]|nr:hypothetical protein [Mucilaginibacter sp.]
MKKNISLAVVSLIWLSCNHEPDKTIAVVDTIHKDISAVKSTTLGITYAVLAKVKSGRIATGDEDTVYASLNNIDFTIYPDGNIEEFKKGSPKVSYKLSTNKRVETAFISFYRNNLIVYYTETDSESGGSVVESFDTATQKLNWKARAYGFNLGNPVIKTNIAYISTIGFVGKLNLETGKYYWKHENLYDRDIYAFNQFDSVLFVDHNVIFISKRTTQKITDSIIVNDATGKFEVKK